MEIGDCGAVDKAYLEVVPVNARSCFGKSAPTGDTAFLVGRSPALLMSQGVATSLR
jgi:hypothetical protein